MSSFRIDRQYVAFETAETQPVYAAVKPQKTNPVPVNDSNEPPVDISKLYNEIYERLQNEHAEQAENMLSKAAGEAQEIIEKAKKQAEELMRQAKQDAVKIKEDLIREKEDLIREIENDAAERKNREETALLDLETKLRCDYTTFIDSMKDDIIGLVMEIVRKIINIKLSQSDEIFMGMIKDALEKLRQTGSVAVRVSPDDYVRYFGKERDDFGDSSLREILDNGEMKITVVEEPGFTQGDLIVESEVEMIDLGIDRQINQIEKAFQN